MLKQGKARRRTNQQGSIMLFVVLSVMMLFTLVSICFDVIRHSTRVSSKNVQKTQAKLTAEKVLTEFIEGYKAGQIAAGKDPDSAFEDLLSIAATKNATNPYIINVSMRGAGGAAQTDFDQNFGKTELHVYKSGSGFTIESICTYSSQTQTASVVFEGTVISPYVPSNTIESQSGRITSEYRQISNGVDGSLYIENKDGTGDKKFKAMSRIDNAAHIYSEYSIQVDDSFNIYDMNNRTKQNEFNTPHLNFQQAPTFVVDGYLTAKNDGNKIQTNVGKIDANKVCPEVTSEYNASNLGNFDGYVRVNEKLIMPKASSITFGTPASGSNPKKDIDVYTHGVILGPPAKGKIDTIGKDFTAEFNNIRAVYPDGFWTTQPSASTDINGNLYVYRGTGKDESSVTQDGSVTMTRQNTCLQANGEIFIEGNVYMLSNGCSIKANKLHLVGKIYELKSGNDTLEGSTDAEKCKNIGDTSASDYYIYEIRSDGKIVKTDGSTVTVLDPSNSLQNPSWNKCGSVDNVIDTSVQRNLMPEPGYDPQTGKTSVTRRKLKDVYKEASANDIFQMDVDRTDPKLIPAAQNISSKYADAMSRTWTVKSPDYNDVWQTSITVDSYGVHESIVGKGLKYTPAGSTTEEDVIKYYGKDQGMKVYQINASVCLNEDQALGVYTSGEHSIFYNCNGCYLVVIGQEDIVIAMPFGSNSAKFRLYRDPAKAGTDASGNPTWGKLYFMYYEPSNPKKCYYYNKDISDDPKYELTTTDGTKTIPMKPAGSDGFNDGMGKGVIQIGGGNTTGNQQGSLVADFSVIGNGSGTITNVYENFKDGTKFVNTTNKESYIMFLVPNDVAFVIRNGNYMDQGTLQNKASMEAMNGSSDYAVQGLIYGLNSHIFIDNYEGNSQFYGQIKGQSVNFFGDNKTHVLDCPMADGSLLGYVGAKNDSVSVIKLQYFQY